MLIVTVLAAYGFARLSFKGKDLVFALFLSLMMIPTELVVITNFVTITNWDMRNSLFWGDSALYHFGVLHLPAEGEL